MSAKSIGCGLVLALGGLCMGALGQAATRGGLSRPEVTIWPGLWTVDVATGQQEELLAWKRWCNIGVSRDLKNVAMLGQDLTAVVPDFEVSKQISVGPARGPRRVLWPPPGARSPTGSPSTAELFWSADGQRLLVISGGAAMVVGLDGKVRGFGMNAGFVDAAQVKPPPGARGVSPLGWREPQGWQDLYWPAAQWAGRSSTEVLVPSAPATDRGRLKAVNVDSGAVRDICPLQPGTGLGRPGETVVASADARSIAMFKAITSSSAGGVWVWRQGAAKPRPLAQVGSRGRGALSPDGRCLVSELGQDEAYAAMAWLVDDGKELWTAPRGTPPQIQTCHLFTFDPAGKQLAFVTVARGSKQLYVTPALKYEPRALGKPLGEGMGLQSLAWSADGKKLVLHLVPSPPDRIIIWH